jgi:uncharacterized membrane protein
MDYAPETSDRARYATSTTRHHLPYPQASLTGDITRGYTTEEQNVATKVHEPARQAITPAEGLQALEQRLYALRHHKHYQDNTSPYAGGSSFMERVSEAVASGMGTVPFLLISSAVILTWFFANHVTDFVSNAWKGLLNGHGFDPAPFILLNLIFSAVAFYTGALVIIAQKAQTRTDKANEEAAAKHREELAQFELELLKKNTDLTEQIHAMAEQLNTLTEEVHKAICVPPPTT